MGQFEKFNKMYDVEALREELNEMKNKKGEFKEIPDGQYEVSIKKMALAESSTGKPMLKVDMVIVAGEEVVSFVEPATVSDALFVISPSVGDVTFSTGGTVSMV